MNLFKVLCKFTRSHRCDISFAFGDGGELVVEMTKQHESKSFTAHETLTQADVDMISNDQALNFLNDLLVNLDRMIDLSDKVDVSTVC